MLLLAKQHSSSAAVLGGQSRLGVEPDQSGGSWSVTAVTRWAVTYTACRSAEGSHVDVFSRLWRESALHIGGHHH